jgi:hypothetical protein
MMARHRDFTKPNEAAGDDQVQPPARRRTPTGLWLHVGAGAALIVVMAVAALFIVGV